MTGDLAVGKADLSLIIVTHNSAGVVGRLIGSLPADVEIICVDNASSDDIAAVVAPFPAKLVRNERNLGYGAACNRGAALASGEHLFFVNPDIALAENMLLELSSAISRYPDCAVFSPRIEDEGGR